LNLDARQYLKDENCFVNTDVTSLECGLTPCWELSQVGSQGIGQCGSSWSWLFLFWYSSVWRNCYWHVHVPSESWNSEPLKQIMDSAAGQWVDVNGFIVGMGVTCSPMAEKEVVQRMVITKFEKCRY